MRVEVTVAHGDSISTILRGHGVDRGSAAEAVEAIRQGFEVRRIRPGDRIVLSFATPAEGAARRLIAVHLDTARDRDLTVLRAEDGSFMPASHARAYGAAPPAPGAAVAREQRFRKVEGVVAGGMRRTLLAEKVPEAVIADLMSALAYDPDLPGEPGDGARYKIVYGLARATGGGRAQLLLCELVAGRRVHHLYRYDAASAKDPVFLDDKGHVFTPFAVRRPIAVAKVTSPFGWRMHPVLDRPEFHKGVDYAAPPGTPVHASAPGRVVEAHWHGNYGLMVRLEHAGNMETTYSHLKRLARHLRVGQHVEAGQVIGYVGSTGLSTGPHLYFEVFKDGRAVDPLRAEAEGALVVAAPALRELKQRMATIERLAAND